MNVLWLTSSYPRYKGDTASIFLKYLAESLSDQNIKIRIITPDHISIKDDQKKVRLIPFKYFIPRSKQKLAYGSGILPNLKKSSWLYIQIPFFLTAMLIRLIIECINDRPDIIHVHWVFPQGLLGVIVGMFFNIPTVLTAHGGDAYSLNKRFLQKIKSWTIRNSTVWTSNTPQTQNAVLNNELTIPEAKIIPMGVDYQHFSNGDSSKYVEYKSGKKVILFVGRLVEKKGVTDLINAYSNLSENIKDDYHLWIVGDGELRNNCTKLVNDLNIDKFVTFWGTISHKELPNIYASADMFVAPSIIDMNGDTEGQGVVFLEAMASGLPVITTDVGGIGNIIRNNENGITVESNKPELLTLAIETLVMKPHIYNKYRSNSLLLVKEYDWQAISRLFMNLYLETASDMNFKNRD